MKYPLTLEERSGRVIDANSRHILSVVGIHDLNAFRENLAYAARIIKIVNNSQLPNIKEETDLNEKYKHDADIGY